VKTEVSHPVGAAPKWSPTEDAKLLRIMKKVQGGNGWSWQQVATAHGTRSYDACRNRYVASDAHKAYLASIGRQLSRSLLFKRKLLAVQLEHSRKSFS
jgi:hypothetical protein